MEGKGGEGREREGKGGGYETESLKLGNILTNID